MEMAMVRMDNKFRLVIPKRLRESIGIIKNTSLFVYTFESLIFIRKVESDKTQILESVEKLRSLEAI